MNKPPVVKKMLIEINLTTGLYYLTTANRVFKNTVYSKIIDQIARDFNDIAREISKMKEEAKQRHREQIDIHNQEIQEEEFKDIKHIERVRDIP